MKKKYYIYVVCLLGVFMLLGIFLFDLVMINQSIGKDDELIFNTNNNENMTLTKKRYANASDDVLEVLSVTATINPDIAIEQSVTWEINWANSSETKTISDYVSISPSSTEPKVNVTVIKSFPTQIVLKCTSVSNKNVSATCSIDCYKRLSELYIDQSKTRYDNGNGFEEISISNESKIIDICGANDFTLDSFYMDFNGSQTYKTIGTTDVTVSCNIYINISTELKNAFSGKLSSTPTRINIGDASPMNLEELLNSILSGFSNNLATKTSETILCLRTTDHWFDLTLEFVSTNQEGEIIESYQIEYVMIGFVVTYYTEVKSINLDKTSIII